ncbi:RpL13 [Nucleospora cyclopteri]
MKRNNALPNNHFKKTAKRVKTWLDQPARAVRRRKARAIKAKSVFPAPVHKLRPVVRCCTLRYNKNERLGKGFTAEECKAAGIEFLYARTIGISVDLRRKNMNMETFNGNVQRLKEYMSKITIYKNSKEVGKIKQVKGKLMPIEKKEKVVELIKKTEIAAYK